MPYYPICVDACNKVSEFAVGCPIVCKKNGFYVFISCFLYLLCSVCVLFRKHCISVFIRECVRDTENSGEQTNHKIAHLTASNLPRGNANVLGEMDFSMKITNKMHYID